MNKKLFFVAKAGWFIAEVAVTFAGCLLINAPIEFMKFLFRTERTENKDKRPL